MKTQLGLSNITIVEQRVEQYQPVKRFDGVLTRALADLSVGCRLCRHLMDEETAFYAMKSSRVTDETDAIDPEFFVLAQHSLDVPFLGEDRTLVVLKRKAEDVYP